MWQYDWKSVNNYCVMFVNSTGVRKSSSVIEIAIVKVNDKKITDTFISKVKPKLFRKDIKDRYKDYNNYKTLIELLPDIQNFIKNDNIVGWCNDFVYKIIEHDTKVCLENHFIDLFIPYKRYYNNNYGDWYYCSLPNVYKDTLREKAKPYNFDDPYERCLAAIELYEHRKEFNKFLYELRKESKKFLDKVLMRN